MGREARRRAQQQKKMLGQRAQGRRRLLGAAVLILVCGTFGSEDTISSEAPITAHKTHDSVAKERMEAQAAEMLAEEERNEEALHREAVSQDEGHDLGESAEVSDDDPTPPWVEAQKAREKQQRTRAEEANIEQAMRKFDGKKTRAHKSPQKHEPVHGDLGESDDMQGDLGESDDMQVQAGESDANTLTSRAQESTRAQTKMNQRAAALHRAKQIADKVRKLVKRQQKLETVSGQKVPGSILGEAHAQEQKAAEMSRRDELLAQKMEDEQAQQTMKHLIESERQQQRKAFEQERESTHSLLKTVRQKLQLEQQNMIKQVKAETTAAVSKVEEELSQTSLAKTIEDVVKKKLSKRLDELKSAGERTVHDATSQIDALKHRVRRLRRQQTRFKMSESSLQQKMLQHESQHDLGESSGVGGNTMSAELEKLRMEQMMRQLTTAPQPQVPQPQVQSEEHLELLRLKDEMATMREQNQLLQNQVANQMSMRFANLNKPKYSHDDLQKYFRNRHRANTAVLRKSVAAEKERLRALTSKLNAAEADDSLGDSGMLLQLSEGSTGTEPTTALPLYHQRAEQARVDGEDLRNRALEAALESQHFGE